MVLVSHDLTPTRHRPWHGQIWLYRNIRSLVQLIAFPSKSSLVFVPSSNLVIDPMHWCYLLRWIIGLGFIMAKELDIQYSTYSDISLLILSVNHSTLSRHIFF